MALSAYNKAIVYQIWGVPAAGYPLTLTTLVHWPYSNVGTWEPTWNLGNYDGLRTQIDTVLSAMSAETQQLVEEQISVWQSIATSEMKITESPDGSKGVIIDDDARRENIRQLISNAVGFAVPKGGFLHEIQATFGASLARLTSGGNNGDR